jgi:hypothetical protein
VSLADLELYGNTLALKDKLKIESGRCSWSGKKKTFSIYICRAEKNTALMEDFNDFFERELNERRNKIFNTKKKLKKLILGEIQQDNEENAGTAIRNSGDSVEDITKRNMLESRDIQLEKVNNDFPV